jgi:hypothetical protein
MNSASASVFPELLEEFVYGYSLSVSGRTGGWYAGEERSTKTASI